LASGIYADRSETEDVSGVPAIHGQSETDGYQVEIQHLLRHERFNTIVGGGRYDVDALTRVQLNFPAPLPSVLHVLDLDTTHNNAYLYSHFYSPWRVTWTLGVSYDDYKQKNAELEVDKFNPKFGIQWDVTERIRMRAAYVEAVKRALVLDQTIEPTQVAGFNQLYDDPNGTEMERYGLGLDTVLSANLYGGVEVSRRDLVVPGILSGESVRLDRREDLYRAYLYWAPSRSWAFSLEADFERFKRSASDPSVVFGGDPSNVDTLSAAFFLRYFHPKGLFASLGGTFVHQELDLSPSSDLTKNSDEFFVLDASIGYRLPRRWGLISLEGRNLLDEEFFFQDLDTQTATGNVSPRFIPDRTFLLRATFAFN
jgi:outer membrane receptor protein involved in Fe transport